MPSTHTLIAIFIATLVLISIFNETIAECCPSKRIVFRDIYNVCNDEKIHGM